MQNQDQPKKKEPEIKQDQAKETQAKDSQKKQNKFKQNQFPEYFDRGLQTLMQVGNNGLNFQEDFSQDFNEAKHIVRDVLKLE